MTGDTAIRVRDVSHQFGEPGDAQFVQALQHTSLDIARGELLCLIGPSGCGKSTLLNMIGGLLTPTTGTVEVHGKPVRGPAAPRHRLRVPGERAVSLVHDRRERQARHGVPGRAEGRARAARAQGAGGGRAQGFHGPLSGAAFRRHAPARGAGPRAQPADRHAADGRAVRRARRADPHDPRRGPVGAAVAPATRPSCSSPIRSAKRCSSPTASRCSRRGPAASRRSSRSTSRIRASPPSSPRRSSRRLRNTLYELLHEEIRKAVEQSATAGPQP